MGFNPMLANLSAPDRSSFMHKLWGRLGFGQVHPDPSHMEGDVRFAPGALMTVFRAQLDWKDRLRILLSGKIIIRTRTLTDVPINVSIAHSTFSICRPGEPL